MKLKLEVDTTEFKKKSENLIKKNVITKEKVVKTGMQVFTNVASLYVPPNMGKKSIDKNLYSRVLLYLPKEVKKDRNKNRAEDIEKLRQGFLYKIYRKLPLSRKFKAYYFKKLNGKTKKFLKILYRGLLRASYASNIESIGLKVPANIRRIISKSKSIKKRKDFNTFIQTEKNDVFSITILNQAEYAENRAVYAKIAKRNGDKKAQENMNRAIKKYWKEKKEQI